MLLQRPAMSKQPLLAFSAFYILLREIKTNKTNKQKQIASKPLYAAAGAPGGPPAAANQ